MIENRGFITNRRPGRVTSPPMSTKNYAHVNEALNILIDEGGESFYKYADWLGLVKDPNLVVLSSRHHYFYDADEMKNVRTIINLKELNRIKEIKTLFHTCLKLLPEIRNFIGCFTDNDRINGDSLNGSISAIDKESKKDVVERSFVTKFPIIDMLYNIIDTRINTYMSKRSVSLLMEDYGFKIIDMTYVNGRTFFYSQKTADLYN